MKEIIDNSGKVAKGYIDTIGEKENSYWNCKCGEVNEISHAIDLEWYVCYKCKRSGSWVKENA